MTIAVIAPVNIAVCSLALAIVQQSFGTCPVAERLDPVARRGPQVAASSSVFISRTASRRPTKTARLTIAWPMFSSAISGMRRRG